MLAVGISASGGISLKFGVPGHASQRCDLAHVSNFPSPVGSVFALFSGSKSVPATRTDRLLTRCLRSSVG